MLFSLDLSTLASPKQAAEVINTYTHSMESVTMKPKKDL